MAAVTGGTSPAAFRHPAIMVPTLAAPHARINRPADCPPQAGGRTIEVERIAGDGMGRMWKRGMPAAGLAFILTACAGSADMSSMPPVPPEPDTPGFEEERRRAFAEHPEFRNQYGLSQVKAHYAYARGATGKGIVLGIVDSGVDPSHPKFEGKLETVNVEGYDPDFDTCGNLDPGGACQSLVGHGTFVAGIMAASRRAAPDGHGGSASAIHGVAFDADVISVGFRDVGEILEDILGENPTPEQIHDLPDLIRDIEAGLERQFAQAFERLNDRVSAVNASFGLPGNIEDFDAEALRARFPNAIDAIAQSDTPAGGRTIYVWAAGNAGGEGDPGEAADPASSVEIAAGLPVRIPELRGHSLAVVATGRDGRIAPFSSRCGIAKEFCLAAPGVGVAGPVPAFYCPAGTPECYLAFEEAGTSAAAPFVTGGIGLLAQHFRNQLGNDEIVARILATADRSGVYADSDTYGQGFLDLDAATRPVGETRMLTGRALPGSSAPSVASIFHLGGAFGDSLTRGLASREVASFDELDAPFFVPLVDRLRRDSLARPRLGDRLRTLGRDPRGASWRTAEGEVRLRLDAAPPRMGAAVPHGSPTGRGGPDSDGPISGSIGSLSLTHGAGNGQLLFGYRAHPGWRFGLHAGAAAGGAGPITPGTFTDDAAFANPFLGFARDGASVGYAAAPGDAGLRIAAFQGTAQYGERRDAGAGEAAGVLAEYRFGDALMPGLSVQAGWLAEPRGLVGSRPRGAFGALEADTVMAGLSAHRRLDDRWKLLASAHAGMSRGEVSGHGMVRDVSALRTGAFALGLLGEDVGGGRLGVRLAQPLRVEAGRARLRWVSGRTVDGQAMVEQADLDLEPSGRQLDLELNWSRPLAGGEAHMAAIASRDAGHVRGEHEAMLLMRWRRAF